MIGKRGGSGGGGKKQILPCNYDDEPNKRG
jgi:hypothetical protein